jgi:hypothetical protein
MGSTFTCFWCRQEIRSDGPVDVLRMRTRDHIVPLAIGGTDDDANLVNACFSCNQDRRRVTDFYAVVNRTRKMAEQWDNLTDEQREKLRKLAYPMKRQRDDAVALQQKWSDIETGVLGFSPLGTLKFILPQVPKKKYEKRSRVRLLGELLQRQQIEAKEKRKALKKEIHRLYKERRDLWELLQATFRWQDDGGA